MADVRITDLVDPKAIEDLRTTQEEIKKVRDIYMEVISLTAQAIKVKVETSLSEFEEFDGLMCPIRKFNLSRNADSITLALNSTCENAINLALINVKSSSNISCGYISIRAKTLQIRENSFSRFFHSHNNYSP